MKNLKNWKENSDNRGFSFVLVIVAMSVVALLIAVVLMVAYQNYQMKVTGLQSENNFYSAEQVIDEIKAGLQEDMSGSVSDAYSYVMEHYSETDGQDGLRNWYFKTQYVDNLYTRLADPAVFGTYNLDVLKKYIVQGKSDATVTAAEDEAVVEVQYSDGSKVELLCGMASEAAGIDEEGTYAEGTKAIESSYDKGITLRGLTVRFTSARGLLSVISTDLVLGIPEISFTQTEASPDLFTYCLIGEKGVEVKNNSGSFATVKGDLYAGEMLIENAKLKITAENNVVVKDDITVVGNVNIKDGFNYKGGNLWTNGINLDSADATFEGNTFVRDDLTLDGYNSSVKATGRYYGYSNAQMLGEETNSSVPSSAVVVNGRNSVIDFSGLNDLLLAGNAYINIGSVMNESNTGYFGNNSKQTIRMGESIAVKSNQLAYLAPASAIRVTNGTIAESGNPVTITPDRNANNNGYKTISVHLNIKTPLKELGGKTLEELGISTGNCMPYIVRTTENTGNQIVYVYMNLNQKQAADYFKARYGADLKEYANIFLPAKVQGGLSGMNRLDLNGNVLDQASSNLIGQDGTINATVRSEVTGYYQVFQALTTKLITKYGALTPTELTKDVFSNIVDVASTENADGSLTYKFADLHGINALRDGTPYMFKTKYQNQYAVLVEGNYTLGNINDTTDRVMDNTVDAANIHLIVATGDVTVKTNFEGLIICGGKINLRNGATITASPEKAAMVFQCIYDVDGNAIEQEVLGTKISISPMSFFKEGQQYLLNGIASGYVADTFGEQITVSDYIKFANWKKQ